MLLANRGDTDEAQRRLREAADLDDTDAQYNLGLLLATGLDPPELAEARTWWIRAADAGNTGARDALEQFGDD